VRRKVRGRKKRCRGFLLTGVHSIAYGAHAEGIWSITTFRSRFVAGLEITLAASPADFAIAANRAALADAASLRPTRVSLPEAPLGARRLGLPTD